MTPAPPLPVSLSSLVGRDVEAIDLDALLRRSTVRLVTLTGPGGVGKTRLALHVANGLHDLFPDGIWLVRLESIREVDLVLATIAKAVGIADSTTDDLVEHLTTWLGPGRHLFVIDNFEQVSEASPVLGKLLEAAPGLKILVTSRTSLAIAGEHEYPLGPLKLPSPQSAGTGELMESAAVRLFVERASEIRPSFALTSANAEDVLAICRQLDGLPLAIELAAARTRVLTPAALRERLTSRLKVLTSGSRTLPPRQQTMRDAIAWSYNLLPAAEQRLLRILSVFTGGFTLESLEFVLTHLDPETDPDLMLEQIGNLVDQSLVRRLDLETADPRFDLFLTIQEFGREELGASGEAEAVHRGHAEFVIDLIERAEDELVGPIQLLWLERLGQEHDNIRAALTFAIGIRDAELALRIPARIWRFWWFRGHLTEGRRWFRQVLDLHDGSLTSSWAYCLRGAGALAEDQGYPEESLRFYDQALAAARELGDSYLEAQVLGSMGTLAHDQGRYDDATEFHLQAQALYQKDGYKRGVASSYSNLAAVAFYRNDLDGADENFQRALDLLTELQDQRSMVLVLGNLGAVAHARLDFEKAREMQERALAATRAMGDEWGMSNALTNLGNAWLELGDIDKARDYNLQALEIVERLNLPRHAGLVVYSLGSIERDSGDLAAATDWFAKSADRFVTVGDLARLIVSAASLAEMAHSFGNSERAAMFFGFSEALRLQLEVERPEDTVEDFERITGAVHRALGDERYDAAYAAGASLSTDAFLEQAGALRDYATSAPQDPRDLEVMREFGLTMRELQIVRLFAVGKANTEIADQLDLAEPVVTAHIGRLFTRLGMQSRGEITAFAFKHGLI